MGNTGYKSFASLELYFTDDNSSAGVTKPNVITDPDYIAPVLDKATCPPSVRYYNVEKKLSATKNNCSSGYNGSNVTLTAFPNQFMSTNSQADANAQADAWLLANVQTYANGLGTCEIAGDTTPPQTPILSSSLITALSIQLTWTRPIDNIGVTGYQMFRKVGTAEWESFYNFSSGSTLSYTDTAVLAQHTYSYKIRARDAASNWSVDSNVTSQTTGGTYTGSGGTGCFVKGTLITLPDGTRKAIEELALDQLLLSSEIETLNDTNNADELYKWSCDYLSENRITSPITKLTQSDAYETMIINEGLLEATPTHLQLIERDGFWRFIPLGDIKVGDHLYTIDKEVIPVRSVSINLEKRKIYPLTLNPHHTYFANGILTHNYKQPIESNP